MRTTATEGDREYTTPNGTILSFERPDPSASPVGSGLNHLARAETWVLGWMEDAGYAFDLYSDIDFHRGIDDFDTYKALVLHTHPQYLDDADAQSPRVVHRARGPCAVPRRERDLRARGVSEQLPADRLRDNATGVRDLFRALTPPRPERAVLGVGYEGDNWSGDTTFYRPYRVEEASHRFFAGTGLNDGD